MLRLENMNFIFDLSVLFLHSISAGLSDQAPPTSPTKSMKSLSFLSSDASSFSFRGNWFGMSACNFCLFFATYLNRR